MNDADSERCAGLTSGSDKGKEKVSMSVSTPKVGSRSPPRESEALTEPSASSKKKRRLVHSDGSSILDPTSGRQ
jgi:hypothetical protein